MLTLDSSVSSMWWWGLGKVTESQRAMPLWMESVLIWKRLWNLVCFTLQDPVRGRYYGTLNLSRFWTPCHSDFCVFCTAFSLSILNIKVTNMFWYGIGNRSDDVTQGFRQCLRSWGTELQLSPSSLVWRCIGTVWALCFFLTLVCGGKGTGFLQYSIALPIVLYGSCCNILADFSHPPCLWTTEGSVRTPAPSVHLS